MVLDLRYLRFNLFVKIQKKVSKYVRSRRMKLFIDKMEVSPETRILDLGGSGSIWDSIDIRLHITCLNLPGIMDMNHKTHHYITYIEGDACNMPQFKKGDFDIVFSNSVIEHLGSSKGRMMFAREVTRLGCSYWIQTPSILFPVEAHCGMPFWWLYPQTVRNYFLERWSKKLPEWTKMVDSTTVISRSELKIIFPSCNILTEYFIFPKSLVAYFIMPECSIF